MENLKIEGTTKTPTVSFDSETAIMTIKGRSIPENSIDFYKPIVDWLDAYATIPGEKTVLNMQLEYFNTSSSKCILDVFKKLENIKKSGKDVQVHWHYEEDDEDMLEAGEDYDAIIDIDFEMVRVVEF
ncbi:DUF1987 domain-containing protein [Cryomorpha ignava]|uniref:DUF1987 domain-containing protein n=1 Tax=Cryomorpha ignava TaxID=101383 RepID=A0A7K3WTX3_9FLAO|nr:DUF1987 domain-containing protein [Cryomorpha ignava]NEN24332.1 DUF1987 domain-containing protein [Cryomorpha ignava]